MKITGAVCDICDHTFRDADCIIGLLFHGSLPGEFTKADPADTNQHICRDCCKSIAGIYESLTRKAVR